MTDISISEATIKQIDDLLVEEMTRHGSPGLSIGVVSGQDLIFTRNYGAMDLEKNIPATSDTLYMIASITKSFTCCGILKLVEQGKLGLDDKISNHLPLQLGFKDNPIQIRHMMSHTTGIPDLTDALWDKNEEDRSGLTYEIPKIPFSTWDDVFRHFNAADQYVSEIPGRRFYYNNMVYDMLGKIIEDVSGIKFGDYIKQEILNPLGMTSSSFYTTNLANNPNLAIPYIPDPDSKVGKLLPTDYPEKKFISAAGGLFSSINELANYAIMQMNGGKFDEIQILKEDFINQMQRMQFVESYPNNAFSSFYGSYGKTGYGYGFAIHEDFFEYKLVQHSGSYRGSSTWLAMLPEKSLALIFLSNKHPSPRMFAQILLLILLNKDLEDHPLLKLRNHHEMLTGKYETYKKILSREVISKEGGLFMKYQNPEFPPQQLIPADDNYHKTLNYYIFTEIGGKMPVQFEKDKSGMIWMHIERQKWRKID